ncbi:hypothetical protein SAMN05661091_0848 [Paenibacillus uliginis N3/975]|uniref:Uncharacterized protein n=1 Tax=Paenibacillus uliginis N3/975 TaxID=1313296 RepID=A0A1X7GPK6_9BACL|nr:hypothetical protein [Paenibacillus uliginis]SMF72317.1 hypothetical protein SAMN05661091_0848 [Paenibacillus uliginis N3/975]
MRGAVRQAVSGIIPELEGRVYDVHPPDGANDDLYAVIALGEDVWKSSWAGYRQVVRLKLYAGSSGLSQMDAWAEHLIKGLHRKRVTGTEDGAFILHYLGVPEADKLDPVSGKTFRMLRFGIYMPEASGAGSTSQPDEWLSALAAWTGDLLGNPWRIYHTSWPAGRDDNAILWRMTGCETKTAGASKIEVRKSFIGHVASPVLGSDQLAIVKLVEALGSKVQLLLDSEDRRYMSVVEVSSDLQADPILDGQLKLTLMQRKMRPAEEAALIRHVNIHPILK